MGFDLSSLAPALGGALRGYTGGLAQGEQAKLNLLQQNYRDMLQQQQFDAQQKYQQQTLDLHRAGLQAALLKASMKAGQDPFQKAMANAAGTSIASLFTTPNALAEADANGTLRPRLAHLINILGNEGDLAKAAVDPRGAIYAGLLLGDPVHPGALAAVASAPSGSTADSAPTPASTPDVSAFTGTPPALVPGVQGVEAAAPSLVPPPAPVPNLTPHAIPFSPEYTARVGATMAQGADALAGANLKTAQIPQVAPDAASHRALEAAQAAQAGATAISIPQKTIETQRHNQALEAIDRFKSLSDALRAKADVQNANTNSANAPSLQAQRMADAAHLNAEAEHVRQQLDPQTAAYLKGIGPVWKKGLLGEEFSEEAAQAWEKALHLPPGTIPRPGAVAPTPIGNPATMSTKDLQAAQAALQAQAGAGTGQGAPAGPAAATSSNFPNAGTSANPTATARANAAAMKTAPPIPNAATGSMAKSNPAAPTTVPSSPTKPTTSATPTAAKTATGAPIQNQQEARKTAAQIKVLKQQVNDLKTRLQAERDLHGAIRAQDQAQAAHYQQNLQHEINTLSQRLNAYRNGPTSYPSMGGGAPDINDPATYGINQLHPAFQPPPIVLKKKK